MINIEDASKDISKIIERHMPELNNRYSQVDHNGAYLKCTKDNRDTIKLQVIPDQSRRQIAVPQSSREYQAQGGHKGLIDKFIQHNPGAWKIDVKVTSSGLIYEIAFSGNENNWDAANFEKDFIKTFLTRR